MGIGQASDFIIYEPEFYGGVAEKVAQFLEVFNANSAGCLRIVPEAIVGEYNKESFFKSITNIITRRNTASVASVDDLPMSQDEIIGVKVNRKFGPISQTLDAWRKVGKDPREMSFILGGMFAEEQLKDYINTSIMALEAALSGQAANCYDGSAGTMTHLKLVSGLSKMGDAQSRIIAWVMHSKVFFDLLGQSITDEVVNIADMAIAKGTVATLGRPVIVTDVPALWDLNASATDSYNTLGLVSDALVVKESEEKEIVSEIVTGLENLVFRVQGEYAFNINVKGFKWDISHGGPNPLDATIATGTNWDKVVTDDKDLAGVHIKTL